MTPIHPKCNPDGHYSQTQAALALGVTPKTVARWVHGYSYTYKGETQYRSPILHRCYNKRLGTFFIYGRDINRIWEGK